MSENDYYLESNLPASIDIEEMIVGRFTARQLVYICVGGALFYNIAFKMSNHYIGWTLGILVLIATYFLGFYKIKKFDANFSDYVVQLFRYKNDQQVYLNKD